MKPTKIARLIFWALILFYALVTSYHFGFKDGYATYEIDYDQARSLRHEEYQRRLRGDD